MIIGRDHAATSEYRISNMPVLSRVSSMPLRGFLHLGCAFATTMLMIGAGGVGITSAKAQNGLGAPNSSATLLAELASNTSSFADKAALGEALYFDTNLSKNRTQACASCHEPTTGFRDPRSEIAHGAYSLGDDGASLGDRNAPMAAYAKFAPD
ncbi:MAG TPA: methylamine utilization protein MauG, partial [Thalassospira sp.]|nr:methylamine utilization protein MauG [Thalassospira sp.]